MVGRYQKSPPEKKGRGGHQKLGSETDDHGLPPVRMSALMSSTRQAVMRFPRVRTGCGYRPDFTPAHQVDFPTGISAGTGGLLYGSPTICFSLIKPLSGNWIIGRRIGLYWMH